jgi:hypothetical protein
MIDDAVKASQTATTGGRKFDGDKLEYGLLPAYALMATVDVLTLGAQKYERDNWIHVPDAKRRYFDALQRHLWSWKMGEANDRETGRSHLAHAMCCLMFLHDTVYSEAYQELAERAVANAAAEAAVEASVKTYSWTPAKQEDLTSTTV